MGSEPQYFGTGTGAARRAGIAFWPQPPPSPPPCLKSLPPSAFSQSSGPSLQAASSMQHPSPQLTRSSPSETRLLPWHGLWARPPPLLRLHLFSLYSPSDPVCPGSTRGAQRQAPGQAHKQGLSSACGLIGWAWIQRVPRQGFLLYPFREVHSLQLVLLFLLETLLERSQPQRLSACPSPSFTLRLPELSLHTLPLT